jgi:hypothetical protein
MTLRLSVIAVVVLVVVVAIIAGTSRAASANDSVHKIRYRTHQVINPDLLDIAKPAGPSTGDELIEKEILYSLDGKRIGYDVLHFIVVTANFKTQTLGVIVVGSIHFKDGTVNIQGETHFQTIRVGATGGTGIYQHAMGELRVLRSLPNGDDIDQLTYANVS